MSFVVGERYSRKEIHEALGGELQSYLPQYGGRVVAGWFLRKRNPEAPGEIQTGERPRNTKKAEISAEYKAKCISLSA